MKLNFYKVRLSHTTLNTRLAYNHHLIFFTYNIYIVASEAVLPEADISWLKDEQANSNLLFRITNTLEPTRKNHF